MEIRNEDLNPSYHGNECLYNGEHEGYEICCDECDFYLDCYPELWPNEKNIGNYSAYCDELFLRFSEEM